MALSALCQDAQRGRLMYETHCSFTLDEREDVVQYLNESHYRFGLAPKADGSGRTSEERK